MTALPERLAVISCDTHVGPSSTQLRPYCEQRLLEEFDAFYAHMNELGRSMLRAGSSQSGRHREQMLAHVAESGEQDSHARLLDMDADGVAAEVIFHGSQNGEVIPFAYGGRGDEALEHAGIRIYNRWLADFCAAAPERRVGLIHLPAWDPGACSAEVEFGQQAGLRAVNFPSLRPGNQRIPLYTSRRWDSFWATCIELELPLVNHCAADLDILREPSPGNFALATIETGWLARRTVWWLIFAGVFDRYPDLQFVLTEQPGDWIATELGHLDSAYRFANVGDAIAADVRQPPSHYFHTNLWIGASFLSNHEAHMYLDLDLADRVLWGSDYPHIEGTWPNSGLAIRKTFSDVPLKATRAMLSGNAIRAYGFDPEAIDEVAQRIGPDVRLIGRSEVVAPEGLEYSMAFRDSATFR